MQESKKIYTSRPRLTTIVMVSDHSNPLFILTTITASPRPHDQKLGFWQLVCIYSNSTIAKALTFQWLLPSLRIQLFVASRNDMTVIYNVFAEKQSLLLVFSKNAP